MRRLVVTLVLLAACGGTRYVASITFTNATSYPVAVDVTSAAEDGWLPLSDVAPGGQAVVEQVADHGDVWIFRFSYLGEEVARERLTRDALERARWRVEVPASVEESLRAKGVEPPPR